MMNSKIKNWELNFSTIVILLLLINAFLSNLLYAFNIANENSFFVVPTILTLMYYGLNYKEVNLLNHNSIYCYLVLILLFITLLGGMFDSGEIYFNNLWINKMAFILKMVIFLIVARILVLLPNRNLELILKYFIIISLTILFISFIFYILTLLDLIELKERLIIYIDHQPNKILYRFGALSFELIDYNLIFCFILILFLNYNISIYLKLIFIGISLFFIYLSYSNISFLFLITLFFSYIIIKINKIKFLPYFIALCIIFFFALNADNIKFILNMVKPLFPRYDGTIDINTAVGARLIPNFEGIEYIKNNLFGFPPGGMSGMIVVAKELPIFTSFIPSGMLQIFLDWKFLAIPLIIFGLFTYNQFIIKSAKFRDFRIIYVVNISIVYVFFQGSYLNYSMWVMILLLSIILYKKERKFEN